MKDRIKFHCETESINYIEEPNKFFNTVALDIRLDDTYNSILLTLEDAKKFKKKLKKAIKELEDVENEEV